jgi:phosphoheptose isomerase
MDMTKFVLSLTKKYIDTKKTRFSPFTNVSNGSGVSLYKKVRKTFTQDRRRCNKLGDVYVNFNTSQIIMIVCYAQDANKTKMRKIDMVSASNEKMNECFYSVFGEFARYRPEQTKT